MMNRPLLLDLFCGAGGCAVGYHRAGFDVVGVDNRPQPRYPFSCVEADALKVLERLAAGKTWRGYRTRDFGAIHASPPCQHYSQATRISGSKDRHPDLVATVRNLLIATGRPYVIENVPGAPLEFSALVCGLALGCGVKRHRLFESSVFLFGTQCPPGHRGDFIGVFGHDAKHRVGGKGWVSVNGGGAPARACTRRRASVELARKAMGIFWMTRDELSQAIPPAYTEYVGRQLIRVLE